MAQNSQHVIRYIVQTDRPLVTVKYNDQYYKIGIIGKQIEVSAYLFVTAF